MPNQNRKRLFVPEPEPIWLGQGKIQEYAVTPAGWGALVELKDILKDTLSEVSDLMNGSVVPTLQAVAGTPADGSAGIPLATPATPNLAQTIQDLATGNAWDLVDRLLQKPERIFKLAIPTLDSALFDPTNPEGITIPQVWYTFEVILEVNKLDFLKNLFGGATPPTKTS